MPKLQFQFAPEGAFRRRAPGQLLLGVRAATGRGCIERAPEVKAGIALLLLRNRERALEVASDPIRSIVIEGRPGFDAVIALYLAGGLLHSGRLPHSAAALARYADELESGRIECSLQDPSARPALHHAVLDALAAGSCSEAAVRRALELVERFTAVLGVDLPEGQWHELLPVASASAATGCAGATESGDLATRLEDRSTSLEGACLEELWSAVEGEIEPAGLGVALATLASAQRAEVEGRCNDAWRELECVNRPAQGLEPFLELVRLRVELRAREDMHGTIARLAEFARLNPEPSMRGRALAARSAGLLQSGRIEEAEEDCAKALGLLPDGRARIWALDTWASVLLGSAAWEEARRAYRDVIALKRSRGDGLGVALSAISLARMELGLGRIDDAMRARELIADETGLPSLTLLRLGTLDVDLRLACVQDPSGACESLIQRLRAWTGRHPLLGYGWVSAAAAQSAMGLDSRESLHCAAEQFSIPEQTAWLAARSLELRGFLAKGDLERMEQILSRCAPGSEAELRTCLFALEHVRSEERPAWADRAYRGAEASGDFRWLERIDALMLRVLPDRLAQELARRFGDPDPHSPQRAREVEGTVVFADLVGFSARSQQISATELLATSQALFELAAPLLVRHRVRPVGFPGDAVLAITEGEGHRERACAFALSYSRRAQRASLARGVARERWMLDLRIGIASGPVVIGSLGNGLRRELAVLGRTVNLASRLQAAAQPGEVLADVAQETDSIVVGIRAVELPGFPSITVAQSLHLLRDEISS